jgi:hypothetical protein
VQRLQCESSRRVFALLLLLLSGSCTTRRQNAAVPPQPVTIAWAVTRVYKSIDGVDLPLASSHALKQSRGNGWCSNCR